MGPLNTAKDVTIKIEPAKTVLILGVFAVILIMMSSTGYYFKFVVEHPMIHNFTLVNLDSEGNIPTYFSSFILLYSSFLLAIIGIYKRNTGDSSNLQWLFLALIFLFLSVDEVACFHEKMNFILRKSLGLSGFFYFGWVVPAILFVIILFAVYIKFIINLPSRTRLLFIIAGCLYVSGALGMEMIGGNYRDMVGGDDLKYGLITSFEETLEMAGIILFIYALLDYLRSVSNKIRFHFE